MVQAGRGGAATSAGGRLGQTPGSCQVSPAPGHPLVVPSAPSQGGGILSLQPPPAEVSPSLCSSKS